MALRSDRTSTTYQQLLEAHLRKTNVTRAAYRKIVERRAALNAAGHHVRQPRQAEPDHVTRGREILNGSGHLVPDQTTIGGEAAELDDLINEQEAYEYALSRLESDEPRLATLALAEWLANGGEDRWNANRRKLADALMQVKQAIAEAAAIRNEAALATKAPLQLPGDLGDRPLLDIHAQRVLEAIKAAGIVT